MQALCLCEISTSANIYHFRQQADFLITVITGFHYVHIEMIGITLEITCPNLPEFRNTNKSLTKLKIMPISKKGGERSYILQTIFRNSKANK